MFNFRKNKDDEKAEDVRILRAKNELLELEVQKIAMELGRLSQKDEKTKDSRNDSLVKDAYEAQVNKLEEKNALLEKKLKEMDQMLHKMKEIEKKKTEDSAQRPMNTPPNWAPPNSSSYGVPPQQPGHMQFPSFYQQGNLPQNLGYVQYPTNQEPGCPPPYQLSGNPRFSGPVLANPPSNAPFAGHQGPRGPQNPNQAPNYSQPSGQYQRGQSSFQPRGHMFKGDNSQRGRGGSNSRFHWSRDEQGSNNQQQNKNHGAQGRDNENFKPRKNFNNASQPGNKNFGVQGRENENIRPQRRDDDKRSNEVKKDKPLFLKTDGQNRARSRPRQKKDNNTNPKQEEERNGEEDEENQKKVRFEHRGRNRGRPYNAGRAMQNRNHEYPDHHDRRTNFKRSSRGRPRNHPQRNTEDAENIDSDDLSESEEGSGEDAAVDLNSLQSSVPVQTESKSNQNMPDITKVEAKTEKKKTPKKNVKKGEAQKEAKAEKSEGQTKERKQSNEDAQDDDDKPLSRSNLGKDDLLMKFIGCNIPGLLDVVCMQIDLSRKVSGVVIMSDPDDPSPILESPKTLTDIVHFKIKHPKAKSILL